MEDISKYCSELGLIRYRVLVEARYLQAFARRLKGQVNIGADDIKFLNRLARGFGHKEALEVKAHEARVSHDVVAVVEYLKERSRKEGHEDLVPFIHFGLTSDDVNNLAYSLMLRDAMLKVYIPSLLSLCRALASKAAEFKHTSMLGHTHGQPASPTTLGKELANYLVRLARLALLLSKSEYPGKVTGAVGNFNALHLAYPQVDWIDFSRSFVSGLGLRPEVFTTQILPHDDVGRILQAISLADRIIQNLDVDIWLYCCLGYLKVRKDPGRVGSSTMPHKVNPVDFENSEGNAKFGASLLDSLCADLQISRMQRDLSDTPIKRNYGMALAYSLLAAKRTREGLLQLDVDAVAIRRDLVEHSEVLSEALQHSLRKAGREEAFEEALGLLKGRSLDLKGFRRAIEESPFAVDAAPVLKLDPSEYVGLAPELVDLAIEEAKRDLSKVGGHVKGRTQRH